MICGNDGTKHFVYRSSSYLTEFFEDCDTDYTHDGSTRSYWVANVLRIILQEPHASAYSPPRTFSRVIQRLMSKEDAVEGDPDRSLAIEALNTSLAREGFEAFYAEDNLCYLRHKKTQRVAAELMNPHRPLSASEVTRRRQLEKYLDGASEDDLIEEVLLPLFRQLGFHRITAAGHKDKALEYGKDVWMKYTLPTQHVLYFGLQAKIGKLDAAGSSKAKNVNVAEIHNQALMMLGHVIFDPEFGREVLVDHAFIVAGGDITKAARNWLGNRLDAAKRSQIIFMDRKDILDLFIVANLPLPSAATDEDNHTCTDPFPF